MLTGFHILLFIILLSIGALWSATTPHKFFDFVKTLGIPKNWLILGFQVLPFLQLANIFVFRWPATRLDGVWIFIGVILLIAGAVLACWAKIVMKTNWGSPGEHNIQTQRQIVVDGPFRITRNPIYLGLLMVFFGFELTVESSLVVLTIFLYWFMIRTITREEILLTRYFGKNYQTYREHVPRFFPTPQSIHAIMRT